MTSSHQPIAIVGLGGSFPGARSLDEFWSNILAGRCAARPTPPDRWPVPPESLLDTSPDRLDRVYSISACPLEERAWWAADFAWAGSLASRIPKLDPLFPLALDTAHRAWLDGGGVNLDPSRAGIILANIVLPTTAMSAMTDAIIGGRWDREALGARANGAARFDPVDRHAAAAPAGLIARALGLGGPVFTLDAACASSLYAIKLACDELREGRRDAMLAGGVSRPDPLFTQMGFCRLRALSTSGLPRPFEARADGLVVGEGAGVFLLKRLADAIRAGDVIHGVIHGVGLSNDRGGSLLAPDTEGQLRAMRAAYAQAGWRPGDVDAFECHATGTLLGDATEFTSVRRLREEGGLAADQPAALGSVKSNIGHLLTAAGAAGLMKMIFAMRERRHAPTANFERPSPKLDLSAGDLRVLSSAEEWAAPSSRSRRAAVSAFGFGGINAHLLIEQWDPERAPRDGTARVMVPVGAEFEEPAIAIVGTDVILGPVQGRNAFESMIFGGAAPDALGIDRIQVEAGRYRIPPREMEEMEPQQALALEVATRAAAEAAPPENGFERVGVFFGATVDMNTTNYSLRWTAEARARRWAAALGAEDDQDAISKLTAAIIESAGAPLTANRTIGGLGSMIASRVARELRAGGPSFSVSADERSGLCAMEIAARALARGELDMAIAGAVDLHLDERSLAALEALRRDEDFAAASSGACSEGAVAFALKRLDDAERAGDRVYGVIRRGAGAGKDASWFEVAGSAPERSLMEIARMTPDEAEGSEPARARGLVGVTESSTGAAGIAAGALALARVALALRRRVLPEPAAPDLIRPEVQAALERAGLTVHHSPQFWFRNREQGPRRAVIRVASFEGGVSAMELEEYEASEGASAEISVEPPLPEPELALFVVTGADAEELRDGLGRLSADLARDDSARPIYQWGRERWRAQRGDPKALAVAIVARSHEELRAAIALADRLLREQPDRRIEGLQGVFYSPAPLAPAGDIAFVFPGSGNAYTGMGAALSAAWPAPLRRLDAERRRMRDQFAPDLVAPWSFDMDPARALARLTGSHAALIHGHVSYSVFMSDLIRAFGVEPRGIVGYSLGETAGNFAMRVWRSSDEMLDRTLAGDLFKTELVGECRAAREVWGLAPGEPADWVVGRVDRPAAEITEALRGRSRVYRLIVNAPDECVIGGRRAEVEAFVAALGAAFHPIEGVSTVHCEIAAARGEAYRALHVYPAEPPPGVRFYSGAWGSAFTPSMETSADSILAQAVGGIDFPKTVEAAYADGARVFVEVGPRNSCSRMIGRILEGRPHLARSACSAGQEPMATLLRLLAALIAERVPVNLEAFYGQGDAEPQVEVRTEAQSGAVILKAHRAFGVAGRGVAEVLHARKMTERQTTQTAASNGMKRTELAQPVEHVAAEPALPAAALTAPVSGGAQVLAWAMRSGEEFARAAMATSEAAAAAHEIYLRASQAGLDAQARAISASMALMERLAANGAPSPALPSRTEVRATATPADPHPASRAEVWTTPVFMDRERCLEFARGSIARSLDPFFAAVDAHPTRVRLPDEPLMFVDRIIEVEGVMGKLGPGRVVTEHDVLPGAWYLDTDRMPMGLSIEAGQADLFLSAYLGIDFETLGLARYRLLDATVTYHRGLPRPGEIAHYDIRIERFIRQGDTHVFFFNFDGYSGDEKLMTMRGGCAGFFTERQLEEGRGLVLSEADRRVPTGVLPADWRWFASPRALAFDAAALNRLRAGDLADAFGDEFRNLNLSAPVTIPGGQMKLIDRVTEFLPTGGRYGLGQIRAEIDIHPDDWFLTCHFVDDMVMPGTLMYESCMHALRVFLMRIGWVGEAGRAAYEPVPGVASKIRCRGQVTRETRLAAYEIYIKEIGFRPEPYAIADAMMYSDERPVVWITNMSLQLTGSSRETLEAIWARDDANDAEASVQPSDTKPAVFTRESIVEFTRGKPSFAFGDKYKPYDEGRFIARLPGEPFMFLDRVTEVHAEPWVMKPGGWIEAQFDLTPERWIFRANRQPAFPFVALLETALQPCGWYSSYMGSVLHGPEGLRYRNLGGTATLHEEIGPEPCVLTTRVNATEVSKSGGMIIHGFHFLMSRRGRTLYEGDTMFGFFTPEALANQVGVRGARAYAPTPEELARGRAIEFAPTTPLDPHDTGGEILTRPSLPSRVLRALDRVDLFIPDGGPRGLGFLRGSKRIDPDEWFFKAHFYMDPVCPGSFGLEGLLLLLKAAAMERWGGSAGEGETFGCIETGRPHTWIYRGQYTPAAKRVEIDAMIKEIDDERRVIRADGWLRVDGLTIYQMKDFGMRLVCRAPGGGPA